MLIVDIGGYTLDYLLLRYGELDTEIFDSLEKGVIPLYNEIRNRIRKQLDIFLEDSDIDLVIREKNSPLSAEIKDLINSVVYEYVVNTLGIVVCIISVMIHWQMQRGIRNCIWRIAYLSLVGP